MKSYQADLYENYAEDFSGESETFDKQRADLTTKITLHHLRGWLPKSRDARILDAGCGGGRNLYALKTDGYRNLHGVDWSDSQVRLAHQVCEQVVCGDALQYLRDASEPFDLITSFDLIEHLSKDQALEFLSLCFEKLNPGASLVLQTPNAASPFFGQVRYGDLTHELAFTPPLLERLCSRAGFAETESREAAPVSSGYSMKSTARALIWSGVRALIAATDLVETGAAAGVYTRVFLTRAVKRA